MDFLRVSFDGAAAGISFAGASTSLSRKSRKRIPDVHAFKLYKFLISGLRYLNTYTISEASDDSPLSGSRRPTGPSRGESSLASGRRQFEPGRYGEIPACAAAAGQDWWTIFPSIRVWVTLPAKSQPWKAVFFPFEIKAAASQIQ